MQAEDLIAVGFLGFLAAGGALLALSVRRGRELCDEFARRLPSQYEEVGRPWPGFFDSPRRNAYMHFVMQRKFADLDDPHLVERFTKLRKSEMGQLVFVLVGFGVLGMAVLWIELLSGA